LPKRLKLYALATSVSRLEWLQTKKRGSAPLDNDLKAEALFLEQY